jgi:hypothetical protein
MVLQPRLSERLNMYRYDDGDVFNLHIDGDWPGFGLSPDRLQMQEWPQMRSCLTMLLYLNGPQDGVQGGHTRLLRPDGSAHYVQPAKAMHYFFATALRRNQCGTSAYRCAGRCLNMSRASMCCMRQRFAESRALHGTHVMPVTDRRYALSYHTKPCEQITACHVNHRFLPENTYKYCAMRFVLPA